MSSVYGRRGGSLVRLLICAVPLAIVGFMVRQALYSPDVAFLSPARDGQWIVAPAPPPGEPKAVFVRRLDAGLARDVRPVIRVAAMREYRISVNGRTVPVTNGKDWKVLETHDLSPFLTAGSNEIRIDVVNPVSPPALLVTGPPELRSGERWLVVTPPSRGVEVGAAVADRDETSLRPTRNPLWAPPVAGYRIVAAGVYLLFIAYALVPLRFKRWLARRNVGDSRLPARRRGWPAGASLLCGLLFAAVALVQLRNAWVYPSANGFDPLQHFEYVQYVAAHHAVPLANQGWEMSQPPLYYAVGAAVYRWAGGDGSPGRPAKSVQMLSPLAALATIAIAWSLLRLLFPASPRTRALGFIVAATLPVTFYISTEVTNETFAALAIGAAIHALARNAARSEGRWRDAIRLGLASGLGLLSKYTGTFAFLAGGLLSGLRVVSGTARRQTSISRWPRLRELLWTVLFCATTVAVCGWLYARNVRTFGTPFIGAWDRRSGFNIVQPPGYHTPVFYSRFGAALLEEPPQSRLTSFWDGMYGSMWGDSHNMFLSPNNRDVQTIAAVCLWLALLPSVAILLGFLQAARHVVTREWDHPYFILVFTTLGTVASMLWFSLRYPIYSGMKAHWALSLIPCAAVFAALGLETMCRQSGRLRVAIYASLALLVADVFWLFWYRGPWS